MAVRRVVTGHTAEGVAIVVSDEEVPSIPIGEAGSASTLVWNREEPGRFPDNGSQPEFAGIFPPPGGCNIAVMELAPEGGDFHEFVRVALEPWADPDEPGLKPGDIVVQSGTRHRWHNRGDTVSRMLTVTVGAHYAIAGGRPV